MLFFSIKLVQPGYSFYTWPCAPILAWFLWDRRHTLQDKRILELGAGTALPGILSAKCGAHVTLTDSCTQPKTLNHIRKNCSLNRLEPGKDLNVFGLTWGLVLTHIFDLGGPIDLIISSDCFYDPSVFEDILVTISYLLENNPGAKFITSYQERSTDWTIQPLLKKWDLHCLPINIDLIGISSDIDINELMGGGQSIHLLEITHKSKEKCR